jgi:hypothetical protein
MENHNGPITPDSMIRSWNQQRWLHDHRSYKFKRPDGTEYIGRRAGGPNDEMIEDLTPPYPKQKDCGMREGDFFDCVKPEGKNDFGYIVTHYDSETNFIKTRHVDRSGKILDCMCDHDRWIEQAPLYFESKYQRREAGCFGGWRPMGWSIFGPVEGRVCAPEDTQIQTPMQIIMPRKKE